LGSLKDVTKYKNIFVFLFISNIMWGAYIPTVSGGLVSARNAINTWARFSVSIISKYGNSTKQGHNKKEYKGVNGFFHFGRKTYLG